MTEMTVNPWLLTTPHDLKAHAHDVPPDLIEGLVGQQSLVTLAGQPGLGKSFFALALATSVATGKTFFGKNVEKGKVIYSLGEGFTRFGNRLEQWEEANQTTITNDLLFVNGAKSGLNISNPDHIEQAIKIFAPDPPSLVIMDTFSTLGGGIEENSNTEIAQTLALSHKLIQTLNTTVVLVHHVTKSTGQVRGASAFLGNSDTVVMLQPGKDDDGLSSGSFSASTHLEDGGKQKDSPPITMNNFHLTDGVLKRDGKHQFDVVPNPKDRDMAKLISDMYRTE